MSDESTKAAEAPAAAVATAAPPAAPPPAAAKPAPVMTPGKAAFLANRGAATPPPAAATAPAAAQEPAAAKRSNIPVRIANELAALRTTASDAKADRDALAPFAKEALGALSKEWREYLIERAGDNPRKQLDELAKAKAKGLIPAGAANPAARPAPATTSESPVHQPAKGEAVGGDPDVVAFRKHAALSEKSNFAAAQFYLANGEAIRRGKAKAQTA